MQHDQAFIGRQPILDIEQNIIGYELLFRHSASASSAIMGDDLRSCSQVLVNTVNNMETQWLLGENLAFINVNAQILLGEFLELLPPQYTVLEVLETVSINEAILNRCKQLRAQGYQIALDDYVDTPDSSAMLDIVDYIKLDIQQLGVDVAARLVDKYKKYPAKLIAEKVETHEEYVSCRKAGFKYFQGFYFAHPETLSARIINPSYITVLNLLNMVSRQADIREIEASFKRDPALSFKLLRYINSVGFGLSCEVQSIRHALTILGYTQLFRWLTLLMVTAGESCTPPALMKTSITRGRLTELLGEGYFSKAESDNLFIIGIFSLLDAMLDMPMEKILGMISLPESVSLALLSRSGIYGPFLQLTEACESADPVRIEQLAASLQMDPEQVNNNHIAALAWAENLGT